jgi:predicted 3-demethylubiquinone-9 3-methyltransferase (glyoxalase superfamily)
MQKITPFLWFDGKAEEAMKFYVSIFKKSKIKTISRWPKGSPFPAGQVMGGTFQLEGQTFLCMDAGPQFKFTPAVSLFVDCKTQKEVDTLYDKLSRGGEKQPCGWVNDKFGLSWQIIPETLGKLMHDKDAKKAGRVMQAMMQMTKIDIAKLKKAYAGK